jgi:hypothetical protein
MIIITGTWMEAAETGVIGIDIFNADEAEIRSAAGEVLLFAEA